MTRWDSYFGPAVAGGLGWGGGAALGVKLAKPDRPVVTLIGDGAFLYNPALGALGAARDFSLPTLTIRNVDAKIVERLKDKARQENRSLEAELRTILERAAGTLTAIRMTEPGGEIV